MGFFHQLRILLWKNLTLKKRSPFVVILELSIPLVLFIILVLIRKKNPIFYYKTSSYESLPLPSAGVVPVLQLFCQTGGRYEDKHGFSHYSNSKTKLFLEQLQSVAEHNNFFKPEFSPDDIDDIPRIYQHIIDDPANLRDQFESVKGLNLSSVLQNPTLFEDFLVNNLTLPQRDAETMLHSKVNMAEVYNLLFGTDLHSNGNSSITRAKRSISTELNDKKLKYKPLKTKSLESASLLKEAMETVVKHIPTVKQGLLYKMVENGEMQDELEVINLLPNILGLGDADDNIDPQRMAELIKMLLLSPTTLHRVACERGELGRVLIPENPQNASNLMDAGKHLCNLTGDKVDELSRVLKSEISDATITSVLNLNEANVSRAEHRIRQFLNDLEKFYMFQRNLEELTILSRSLPQDACPATSVGNLTTSTNLTDSESGSGQIIDDDGAQSDENPKAHTAPNKFAGLLKIWFAMQKIFCGQDHEIP